jgi:hypothetical protein
VQRRIKSLAWAAFSRLPLPVRRRILYRKWVGHSLPRVPVTFTEKIQWRIINDRRELIARGGDKLSMKAHAAESAPSILIPETLWSGEDLASVYDRDFDGAWVLKPTTGSGFTAFGSGSLRDSKIDLNQVRSWDAGKLAATHGEWAYSQSRPGFLIERRIETEDGESPHDLRFFVFAGVTRVIQVDSPRVKDVHRRFYRPDWTPLEVRQGGKILAETTPAPAHLEQMIDFANEIGRDFDFIRVDLYYAKGQIYFGEITPYPVGGLAPFSDPAFDLELGSYWTLPTIAR